MNSKEIVLRALNREPVDRIPAYEHFWPETIEKWVAQRHLKKDELPDEHFGLDLYALFAFDYTADLDARETIIAEDDNTRLIRNGNGALLRFWKNKSGTPEHVDFEVRDRSGWEEKIRPLLMDKKLYPRRTCKRDNWDYASLRAHAGLHEKFFCCAGVNVFECMHPVCGHEYMLMGMALDPDWIRDMCNVYANLIIDLMEMTFARHGKPDGIWFYEDMGFKNKPFMSPQMYKDLIWPGHKKTIEYAHDHKLPVIMHSCGYIEPFIPYLIEAGLDCLQAMEVKAGMDVLKLKKLYGDKLSLFGGLDIRILETNDLAAITAYLESTLPQLKQGSGYLLHTDHSIPNSVSYATYRHFLSEGKRLGTY